MFGIGSRVLWIIGIALAAALAVWWGISQYGMRKVAEHQAKEVVQAVQEAQETRKDEVKVDVRTRTDRRVLLDSVRTRGIPVEKYINENTGCAVDPAFSGLLNSSISNANSAIESARGVPR